MSANLPYCLGCTVIPSEMQPAQNKAMNGHPSDTMYDFTVVPPDDFYKSGEAALWHTLTRQQYRFKQRMDARERDPTSGRIKALADGKSSNLSTCWHPETALHKSTPPPSTSSSTLPTYQSQSTTTLAMLSALSATATITPLCHPDEYVEVDDDGFPYHTQPDWMDDIQYLH